MERIRKINYFKNYFSDFFDQQSEKVKEKSTMFYLLLKLQIEFLTNFSNIWKVQTGSMK